MKSFIVPSLGAPPTFMLLGDEPNYYTERIHYEMSLALYMANQQLMMIQQPEESEMNAYASSVLLWIGDLQGYIHGWISSLVNETAFTDDFPPVPVPPPGNVAPWVRAVQIAIYVIVVFIKVLKEIIPLLPVPPGGKFHQVLLEHLAALVDQEHILDIGDLRIWTKSVSVDEIA